MKALEKIVEAKENMNIGYIEWANDCIDEAIAELEALQSRSCEGCKYFNSSINRGLCFRLDIAVSKTFYCQGYEAKDTQC